MSAVRDQGTFRIGDWLVHPASLRLSGHGAVHAIEPRLLELLCYLAERPGQVIDADELLRAIWKGTFYGDGPLHRAVALLRKALGDDSRAPRYIETLRKRGYRLVAAVTWPDDYARSLAAVPAERAVVSPYVGLRAYGADDADVFFGRDRAIAELMRALQLQCAAARPFVLLLGASGVGKSSLIHAGALPLLRRPEGFDGLRAIDVASVDWRGLDARQALATLADAVSSWCVGDWPVLPGLDAPALLQRCTTDGIAAPLRHALSRQAPDGAAADARARLFLTIDHLESLAVEYAAGDEAPRQLERCLTALLESGSVAVVAACRADRYPALLAALPALAAAKAPSGHVDLLAPRAGEIADMIRRPARLAGLRFERDPGSGLGLDDRLRDAAAAAPGALPLLQHVLQALHARRAANGELSYAAYRDLGGLEGALAAGAERALAACDAAARARLPFLLAKLVVCGSDDASTPSARPVAWSALTDRDERALAAAMIDARLLTSDLMSEAPGIALAHDAVLHAWPRARDWARANRDWLAARARMDAARRHWQAQDRRADLLLGPGRPIEEAGRVLERADSAPDPAMAEYFALSLRAHAIRRRRRRQVWGAFAASSAVGALALALFWQADVRADRLQTRSDRLIDYLTDRFVERVRPLGRLDVMQDVSDAALRDLADVPAPAATPLERLSRARALRVSAEVAFERGDLDASERALVDAGKLLLRTDAAHRVAFVEERSKVAFWRGSIAFQRRRYDDGATWFGRYLQATETLRALEPANPDWALEMSYALNNLGTLAQSQGQLQRARALFLRSATMKQAFAARRPDDRTVLAELADTWSWLALVSDRDGDLDAADGFGERQLAQLRELRKRDPDDMRWRHRIALALVSRADLGFARGRAEAGADYRAALAEFAAINRHDPSNLGWRRHAAYARTQLARLAMARGAEADAARDLAVARRLIGQPDDRAALPNRRMAALVTMREADLQALSGDVATALRNAHAASAALRALAAASPGDTDTAALFAEALSIEGDAVARLRGADAALPVWREARAAIAGPAPASRDRRLLVPWLAICERLGEAAPAAQARLSMQRAGLQAPRSARIVAGPS